MPQQAISFDEAAKQPGAGSSPPPGAIMFDQPGNGATPQQVPVVKPPVATPPKPPATTPTWKPEPLTPEEKRSPFWSGAQKQFGLDPDKIREHQEHPVAQGIKQLAQGLSGWMEATAKDPAHALDPLSALAQGLEFHVNGKDPFGLKGKTTPIDHVINGFKNNDPAETALGAGGFIATLGQLWSGGKAKGVVSKVKVIPDAFPATKILAATNEVLQHSADEFKKSLKTDITKVRTGVGDQINQIANADEAARQIAGTRVTFPMRDVARKIGDAVKDAKAYKSPLQQTNSLVKGMVQRYQQGFTWLDLQKFRQAINEARKTAGGDDNAVLSRVQKDVTTMLSTRATQLGMDDIFKAYNEKMFNIGKHERGIVERLNKTATGLDLFKELSSPSNKPILNDLFDVLGRSPTEINRFIEAHKPLVQLAKNAEGGSSLVGRLQAFARHPLVAGGAGGVSIALPLPGKYILSLYTMGKAGDIMDRIDAAEAIDKLRGQTTPPAVRTPGPPQALPGPSVTPPVTPATPPVAPAPATPSGGFAALGPGPAPIPAAPAPTTASSRIIEAMKSYEAAKQAPPDVGLPPERHAELEAQQNLGRGGKLTSKQAIELDRTELERRSATGEGIPKSEAAPKKPTTKAYESFGVTLNPKDWKTPEDVVSGKKAASEQLMGAVNKRAGDIKTRLDSGAIDAKTATALAHELTESWKKAQASIEKTKSTGISRGARDRVSKAGKVKEATAEVGRQQAASESASGGMDVAEAGIEIDQLDKAYKKAGFGRVYKDIVTKWEDSEHEGDYIELAKQLREGFAGLKKASGQD